MDELSTGHFHMPYDIVREGTTLFCFYKVYSVSFYHHDDENWLAEEQLTVSHLQLARSWSVCTISSPEK